MTILEEMGKKAKEAARTLAVMGEEKNDALKLIAKALIDNTDAILAANKIDVDNGRANGLTESIIDRLSLSKTRIEGMAQGVLDVAALPDPIGAVLSGSKRPNGLNITKVRVPIGVIGIIFEARPNVTSDAASLCLKSGNAVILRGGKEAINSNKCLADIMRSALEKSVLDKNCIQLIEDTTRQSSVELMGLVDYLDLFIPRGGQVLSKLLLKMQKFLLSKLVLETAMFLLMKVRILIWLPTLYIMQKLLAHLFAMRLKLFLYIRISQKKPCL